MLHVVRRNNRLRSLQAGLRQEAAALGRDTRRRATGAPKGRKCLRTAAAGRASQGAAQRGGTTTERHVAINDAWLLVCHSRVFVRNKKAVCKVSRPVHVAPFCMRVVYPLKRPSSQETLE